MGGPIRGPASGHRSRGRAGPFPGGRGCRHAGRGRVHAPGCPPAAPPARPSCSAEASGTPAVPPVGGASIGHVAVYNTSLRGHSDSGARGGSLPGRQTTWPRPSTHSLFPECLPRSPEGRQGVRGPCSGRQRPARECAALGFVSVFQACGMKEAIPIGCQGQCQRARGIWGTETVVICVV